MYNIIAIQQQRNYYFILPDSLIVCEALVPIPNGHVSYHIVDATKIQPGDVASYECDTLYTMLGDQFRVCLRNGTWTGVEPVCEGKLIKPSHYYRKVLAESIIPRSLYSSAFL